MKFRGGEFPTGTTGNFQPELTLRQPRKRLRDIADRIPWFSVPTATSAARSNLPSKRFLASAKGLRVRIS